MYQFSQDGSLILTISSWITRGIYNLCQLHQYGPSLFSDIITVNNLYYFNNSINITNNGDQIKFNSTNNYWKFFCINNSSYSTGNDITLAGSSNTSTYNTLF